LTFATFLFRWNLFFTYYYHGTCWSPKLPSRFLSVSSIFRAQRIAVCFRSPLSTSSPIPQHTTTSTLKAVSRLRLRRIRHILFFPSPWHELIYDSVVPISDTRRTDVRLSKYAYAFQSDGPSETLIQLSDTFSWSKKIACQENYCKTMTTLCYLYRYDKYVNSGKVLQCDCIMLKARLGLQK
jgi:hypothetical protein